MAITEINLEILKQNKISSIIPVFVKINNDVYEITTNDKNITQAWRMMLKLIYFKAYESSDNNEQVMSNILNGKLWGETSMFTRHNFILDTNTPFDINSYIKFHKTAYVKYSNARQNILFINKVISELTDFDVKIYVCTKDFINDTSFKSDFTNVKKELCGKRKNIKKAKGVVGYINGIILTDEEKLIRYVGSEFKNRKLIGDIVLTDEQEEILNKLTKFELNRFIREDNYICHPTHKNLLALGLVRYSMKYYNRNHKGGFWPHFNDAFGFDIKTNKQSILNDLFKDIMNLNNFFYDETATRDIDNITMHSFVADNSIDQFLDFLFDFWRLDLNRNIENLNSEDGKEAFNFLVEQIKKGNKDVMSHTSLLLKDTSLSKILKNRVKRIIKLIDTALWSESEIQINKDNRINKLVVNWLQKERGVFKKEKKTIDKQNITKGEIMFHSPVMYITGNKLILNIPYQRLQNGVEEDRPIWVIKYGNNEEIIITPEYRKDKLGYYVNKCSITIDTKYVLSSFKFDLISKDKKFKTHEIKSDVIRLFDKDGASINYRTGLVPQGTIMAISDSPEYPNFINENIPYGTDNNGLIHRLFITNKGQILKLDKNIGVQVGQNIKEGFYDGISVNGAYIKDDENKFYIYTKLPKVLIRATESELPGISLNINKKHNRITFDKCSSFFVDNDLEMKAYTIDLNEFISEEGLYDVSVNFPGHRDDLSIGSISYLKEFTYSLDKDKYADKDNSWATITFHKSSPVYMEDKKKWIWVGDKRSYTFNFAEKNPENRDFCQFMEDGDLILDITLNSNHYKVGFEIPALRWRLDENSEWNFLRPVTIHLDDLHSKKIYITGPFDFENISIYAPEHLDISDLENEIEYTHGYYDLSKAYGWFQRDRSNQFRYLYFMKSSGIKGPLIKTICRSTIKDVILKSSYKNDILFGDVEIDGNKSYAISIYRGDEVICEKENIIDGHFEIETNVKFGQYQIYVYETIENDDGFDFDTEYLQLNEKPIIKYIY